MRVSIRRITINYIFKHYVIITECSRKSRNDIDSPIFPTLHYLHLILNFSCFTKVLLNAHYRDISARGTMSVMNHHIRIYIDLCYECAGTTTSEAPPKVLPFSIKNL